MYQQDTEWARVQLADSSTLCHMHLGQSWEHGPSRFHNTSRQGSTDLHTYHQHPPHGNDSSTQARISSIGKPQRQNTNQGCRGVGPMYQLGSTHLVGTQYSKGRRLQALGLWYSSD
eukprot:GILJ01015152.1.p4 GENE.GILJ01015152.1~~GILJ01015152.1.p4  ORF type:complete len:116 (-),score=0.24 GILJ01015152.1:473-820(-)